MESPTTLHRTTRRFGCLLRAGLAVGFATASLSVISAQMAGANPLPTLPVTNCSGVTGPLAVPNSLPYEVAQAATSDPSGATIIFGKRCSGANTIVLTGTITIASNLIIQGRGPSQDLVSGNNTTQVFFISSGVTATISGITVENGSAISGGGIFNSLGSTFNVIASVLTGNGAHDGPFSGYGGGIFNDGTVNVTASVLSGNSASNVGGGIDNLGMLNVTASTLTGNSAGVGGGGILNGGTLHVTASTLKGNSAAYGGGGIDNLGILNITASALSGNSATLAGVGRDQGGGIFNGGTLKIAYSLVWDNSATTGGAIYQNGGSTSVANSLMWNNPDSSVPLDSPAGVFISAGSYSSAMSSFS